MTTNLPAVGDTVSVTRNVEGEVVATDRSANIFVVDTSGEGDYETFSTLDSFFEVLERASSDPKFQGGDAVIDATGCIYTRRHSDSSDFKKFPWVNGGWAYDVVENDGGSGFVDDSELERPLTILARNGKKYEEES